MHALPYLYPVQYVATLSASSPDNLQCIIGTAFNIVFNELAIL